MYEIEKQDELKINTVYQVILEYDYETKDWVKFRINTNKLFSGIDKYIHFW